MDATTMTVQAIKHFSSFQRSRFARKQGKNGKGLLCPLFHLSKPVSKIRSGNKISRVARYALEKLNTSVIMGRNIAFLMFILGIFTPSLTNASTGIETNALNLEIKPTNTKTLAQYPVWPVIINQGYHVFHPGIDLDGEKGDPVKPIMKGVVIKTENSHFLYGNSILIDHGNNYQSLYAHLSKINVREGDVVDTRTVIGETGSTGHSTGNHLHLEVYKNRKHINPKSILSY